MEIYSAKMRRSNLRQIPAPQPPHDPPVDPLQLSVNDRGTLVAAAKTERETPDLEKILKVAVKAARSALVDQSADPLLLRWSRQRHPQVQIDKTLAKHHKELLSTIFKMINQGPLDLVESRQRMSPHPSLERALSPASPISPSRNSPKALQLDFGLQKQCSPKPDEDVDRSIRKKLERSFSNLNHAVKKVEDAVQQSKQERMLELVSAEGCRTPKGGTPSPNPLSPQSSKLGDGESNFYFDRQDSSGPSEGTSVFVNSDELPTKRWLDSALSSSRFELFMGLLVLTNSVFIGWEVDYIAQHPDVVGVPVYFTFISYCYAITFLIELLLRMYADCCVFCFRATWQQLVWNYLDIFIVSSSLLEIAFDMLTISNAASSGRVNVGNARVIRGVRVFRLVRLLRMARFVRFVRALRMMAYSIMCTLKLIFWAMVLLATVIYIFSIIFTSAKTSYTTYRLIEVDAPEIPGLDVYWGSIGTSMRSLFLSISGGVSWIELIDPLTQVETVWAYAFLVYISFTYFAVLNVVTGVFCQAAVASSSEDQDSVLQTFLRHKQMYIERFMSLFHDIDNDGTGVITVADFVAKMDDEDVRNYFASLDLEITDALYLFDLFEEAHENGVKVEEFVMGCLRLKGGARSSDMLSLLHNNRLLIEQVEIIADHFNVEKKRITPVIDPRISQSKILENCLDDIAKSTKTISVAKECPRLSITSGKGFDD